jgi:hypothetical protein
MGRKTMPTGANTGRFLRQLGGKGHIYAWTPTLAKRKDMIEIDAQTAEVRIASLKEQLAVRIANIKDPERLIATKARIEKIAKLAQELGMLEEDLAAVEELEKQATDAAILAEKPALKPDDIDLTKKPETNPDVIEEERKNRILSADKEYQSILAMRTKKELIDYLASNFGTIADPKQALEQLRFVALEKRKERVFEV